MSQVLRMISFFSLAFVFSCSSGTGTRSVSGKQCRLDDAPELVVEDNAERTLLSGFDALPAGSYDYSEVVARFTEQADKEKPFIIAYTQKRASSASQASVAGIQCVRNATADIDVDLSSQLVTGLVIPEEGRSSEVFVQAEKFQVGSHFLNDEDQRYFGAKVDSLDSRQGRYRKPEDVLSEVNQQYRVYKVLRKRAKDEPFRTTYEIRSEQTVGAYKLQSMVVLEISENPTAPKLVDANGKPTAEAQGRITMAHFPGLMVDSASYVGSSSEGDVSALNLATLSNVVTTTSNGRNESGLLMMLEADSGQDTDRSGPDGSAIEVTPDTLMVHAPAICPQVSVFKSTSGLEHNMNICGTQTGRRQVAAPADYFVAAPSFLTSEVLAEIPNVFDLQMLPLSGTSWTAPVFEVLCSSTRDRSELGTALVRDCPAQSGMASGKRHYAGFAVSQKFSNADQGFSVQISLEFEPVLEPSSMLWKHRLSRTLSRFESYSSAASTSEEEATTQK